MNCDRASTLRAAEGPASRGRATRRAAAPLAALLLGGCTVTIERTSAPPSPPRPVVAAPARDTAHAPARPVAEPSRPVKPRTAPARAQEALRASLVAPAVATEEERPSLTLRALETTARFEAHDQTALRAPRGAALAEGQRLEFALDPGCYTVIAHGGLGIRELEALIVSGEPPDILGSDKKSGPISVVGGDGECVSVSAPSRVEVIALAGAGRVVVQIFQRAPR